MATAVSQIWEQPCTEVALAPLTQQPRVRISTLTIFLMRYQLSDKISDGEFVVRWISPSLCCVLVPDPESEIRVVPRLEMIPHLVNVGLSVLSEAIEARVCH